MFIPLEYQVAGLAAVAQARAQRAKRALVVMATGLGKTVLAAFDVKAWLAERVGSKRILYLCHQNDILYQAKSTFQAILGANHSYGYYHGIEKTAHVVDVLFASLQTMEIYKSMFGRDEFDYVIIDESHHAKAESYRSTIEYFTPEFLLGLTATPDRLDELDIREIFGQEVYSLPLEEAMARGYLAPVEYHLITDEIQLSRFIETGDRRVGIERLNRSIFVPKRDEEIVKIVARHIAGIEDPRVINFCPSVRYCNHLAEIMPDSFAIHSRIPQKERDVRVEMFRQGLIKTVLVVDSFNEGVDIPSANVLSFLRSTDSRTIFLQQLGRGLRKSKGKEKVVVLDFVANCERVKMVYDLYESVRQIREKFAQNGGEGEQFEPMTLNVNSVEFQERIIPLLNILERTRSNFYSTWQEASQAAILLGITSSAHYRESAYKGDDRLPSNPRDTYDDFPGWPVFLGKPEKDFYKTWQEASLAAQVLGILSSSKYQGGMYKDDPRLPFDPVVTYEDFPGWVVFLGRAEKDFYETFKQATEAARALGIKSIDEYKERYKEDERLPSHPSKFYKNFTNWGEFLGTYRVRVSSCDTYLVWRDAARASRALGIDSKNSYQKLYKQDPKLPSSPAQRYPDFPGWKKFLNVE